MAITFVSYILGSKSNIETQNRIYEKPFGDLRQSPILERCDSDDDNDYVEPNDSPCGRIYRSSSDSTLEITMNSGRNFVPGFTKSYSENYIPTNILSSR